MKHALLFIALLAAGEAPAHAQQDAGTLAGRLHVVIERDGNGHSPTDDEITTFSVVAPTPDADAVKAALPLMLEAAASSDDPLRTLGLTALVAIQGNPEGVASQVVLTQNGQPNTVYKPGVAALLAPFIPKLAAHLTDEAQSERLLAATILGGFAPNPPAAVYPPLLAFLKRDDSISPVGVAVVADLLQAAPVAPETAAAIARFIKRTDQTPDTRASLVETIAGKPNQSQALNKAVLDFLQSDDPSLRARVILSLPLLDLSPELFADTRSRIAATAGDSGENLQVVNAAKAVTGCWTQPKMTAGCPVYQ